MKNYRTDKQYNDIVEKRITQLENALKYAIEQLKEWNPDSEASKELEQILNKT